MRRARVNAEGFNSTVELPYSLTAAHLALAIERIYEQLDSIDRAARAADLPVLEEWCGKATLSALISASLCRALSTVSETLTENQKHNGYPDLLVSGRHHNDSCQSGREGVEVKVTTKRNTVCVDAHGARAGWYLVAGVVADTTGARATYVADLWLARLTKSDFSVSVRRTAIGTRTARINKKGSNKLRGSHVYHAASAR